MGSAILLFPLLIVMLCLELIQRIVTVPFYPLAYIDRKNLRANRAAGKWTFLWWVLDDSIHQHSLDRGFDIEYCDYGKREPLGFITERLPDGKFKEFMRSFGWGAIRNNCINLACQTEIWIGWATGVYYRIGSETSYYEIKMFKHLALPYLELHIGKVFIQAGWIKCGRYQVEFKIL